MTETSTLPYTTDRHPDVQQWLAEHMRCVMHFTRTSAWWLNMLGRFFRSIAEDRIRRDSFASVTDLEGAIAQYIEPCNNRAKTFIWTAAAGDIFAKVTRSRAALERVDR